MQVLEDLPASDLQEDNGGNSDDMSDSPSRDTGIDAQGGGIGAEGASHNREDQTDENTERSPHDSLTEVLVVDHSEAEVGGEPESGKELHCNNQIGHSVFSEYLMKLRLDHLNGAPTWNHHLHLLNTVGKRTPPLHLIAGSYWREGFVGVVSAGCSKEERDNDISIQPERPGHVKERPTPLRAGVEGIESKQEPAMQDN